MPHVILDVMVHAKDIPLSILSEKFKFGSQLYVLRPYLAFVIEFTFGIWGWWYYKGNKSLLLLIVFFNLANFTVFSPDIIGLEKYFANNQILLISVIALQILVTLVLIGIYYKKGFILLSKLLKY